MKRRELMKNLAKSALGGGLVAICGSFTANAAVLAEPSAGGLAVGESIQYDEGLKLTFVKVLRDDRCPIGTQCANPGHAVVIIRAELGNQPIRTYVLKTSAEGRHVSIPSWPPGMLGFKTYSVQLISLTPRRKAGRKPKQSSYRLSLGIETYY